MKELQILAKTDDKGFIRKDIKLSRLNKISNAFDEAFKILFFTHS